MTGIGRILLCVSVGLVPGAWAETEIDTRTLVEMPPETRALLRLEMMDHMAAVNELIGYLGAADFEAVATTAEQRMGLSSMGKHRQSAPGPGRFMPPEMRQIGMGMHRAASDLATTAAAGDLRASVTALQRVTAACVACHNAYRVR